MARSDSQPGETGFGTVNSVLFAWLFAGQLGTTALPPVLATVPRDRDVSTPPGGRLRT
jgi:hypothetical protein